MDMEGSNTHIDQSHVAAWMSRDTLETKITGNERSILRTSRVHKGIEVSIPGSSMLDGPNNH
jgi:hypothetical protein